MPAGQLAHLALYGFLILTPLLGWLLLSAGESPSPSSDLSCPPSSPRTTA
jgi:cytochrome b561